MRGLFELPKLLTLDGREITEAMTMADIGCRAKGTGCSTGCASGCGTGCSGGSGDAPGY